MQQLTKSQIVELRARAIRNGDCVGMLEHIAEALYPWKDYISQAQATIEADEKAGVLMLVEEGQLGVGANELIAYDNWYREEYQVALNREIINGELHQKGFRTWLAARANTPVYQVRKEN